MRHSHKTKARPDGISRRFSPGNIKLCGAYSPAHALHHKCTTIAKLILMFTKHFNSLSKVKSAVSKVFHKSVYPCNFINYGALVALVKYLQLAQRSTKQETYFSIALEFWSHKYICQHAAPPVLCCTCTLIYTSKM